MKIDRVDPEIRNKFKFIHHMPLKYGFLRHLVNFLLNSFLKRKPMPGVITEEVALKNSSVRVYKPEGNNSGAALLWIHGGGLVTGSTRISDRECQLYAKELKLVVISAEYRVAPENPFPCAIDDCFEAWEWLQKTAAELGVDPTRIAVSGQSAGGGLAASLAHRIADGGGIQPACQALVCPMMDDRTAANLENDEINHRVWNNASNRFGWTSYLGQPPGLPSVPQYSVAARREDLTGLPATWISAGDIDLFYAEVCLYAERLKEAGVECELYITPGGPHGFESLAPNSSLSHKLFESNYRFLRKNLSLEQA